MMRQAIFIILTLSGFASGAEMELTDRLSVDGPSLFKNTAVFSGNVGIGTTAPGELLSLGTAGTTAGVLSLADTSGRITIRPAAAAGTYTLTLPASAGSAGQFLQTDGSGTLYWATSVKSDGTVNPANLLSNGDFELWSAGPTSPPDGWAWDYGAVSQESEITMIKLGTYSAKFSPVTAANLYQYIYAEKGINYWRGRKVSLGVWMYTTDITKAYAQIYDGLGGGSDVYATTPNTWQFLTVTRTVDPAANWLGIWLKAFDGASVYYDGAIAVEGDSAFAFSDKPVGYLTGTWTPTITFGGNSAGVTYVSGGQVGAYTKIGKTVFFTGRITLTSHGTSVGNAAIGGLPFTNDSKNYVTVFVSARVSVNNLTGGIWGLLNANDTNIGIYTNPGNATNLTQAQIDNAADLWFSGQYRAQ